MIVLFSIAFFILGIVIGVVLRNIVSYFYNIHKKIRQAEKIIREEQKRLEFKNKYDFSDSFDDDSESED